MYRNAEIGSKWDKKFSRENAFKICNAVKLVFKCCKMKRD